MVVVSHLSFRIRLIKLSQQEIHNETECLYPGYLQTISSNTKILSASGIGMNQAYARSTFLTF